MEKVDVLIVGAGVVGLAISSEIAREDREILILEKEKSYGQGTSSRNSEVVHAGISYPKGSLKAKLCVSGKKMVYNICEENKIAYKKIGKIIVATNEEEVKQLGNLLKQGWDNGVESLEIIDEDQVHDFEPKVKAITAIHSPSTGIIDAHGLMNYFYRKVRRNNVFDPLVLNTEVIGLDKRRDGYIVETLSDSDSFSVKAKLVINAAGLYSDKVAEMAGMDIDNERYRIYWCKGDYFSLVGKPPVRMLVYPVPPKDAYQGWLGIHTVPDLMGRLKFGPNAYYVNEVNYEVESKKEDFWRDIVSYIPSIKKEDLHPDMSGIRPKLGRLGEPFRDFVIRHEEDKGFSGLINLIGIESPGLTCAPAIAKMVGEIVNEIL